ncbi:hypothetical protein pb186bvf_020562 [Paramecium bursaria]
MSLGIENNRFQKMAQLRQSQQELELERPKHLIESVTMDYPDNQSHQDGRFRVPFMQPKLIREPLKLYFDNLIIKISIQIYKNFFQKWLGNLEINNQHLLQQVFLKQHQIQQLILI